MKMMNTHLPASRTAPRQACAAGRRLLFGCYADRRGTVTIFVAVWLLVIAGLAAVGVDGSYWYLQRRQAQNAADMAAIAGVNTLLQWQDYNGQMPPPTTSVSQGTINYDAQLAAANVATENGFTDDVNNADVTINIPPVSGTYANAPNSVEAIVKTRAPFLLSSLVNAISSITGHTIGTRAVASLLSRPGNACLLALNADLSFTGSDFTTGNKCIFASNATDASSINVGNSGGNVTINAYSLLASGGCANCTPAYGVTTVQPVAQYQPPTPNPFSSLDLLDFTYEESVLGNGVYDKSNNTYYPGYYSNGINISSNSNSYTFAPGLYILGGKGLSISSGLLVSCSACTFVMLSGSALSITGADVQFTAGGGYTSYGTPQTDYGVLDGMLFYQQSPIKQTGAAVNDTVNGNTGPNAAYGGSYYSGGIYLPGGNLNYNGTEGSATNGYPTASTICTEIVASQITMTGSGATNINNQSCFGTAAQSPPPQIVALVE